MKPKAHLGGAEHPVDHAAMEVQVGIQRGTETMHERDRPETRLVGDGLLPSAPAPVPVTRVRLLAGRALK